MDILAVCRTCLTKENLNPIFFSSDDEMRYSNAIYVTCGIKVQPNDGLPQNMCEKCLDFLNKSLKFRQLCLEAEQQLLKLKYDIDTRKKTHENKLIPKRKECKVEIVKSEVNLEPEDITEEYTDFEILHDDEQMKYLIDTDSEDEKLVTIEVTTEKTEELKDANTLEQFEACKKLKTERVKCQLCQKDLSVRSLDNHMAKSHPGVDETKTKCELCDKYISVKRMGRHMKMHGEDPFRCGYCKTEFESKEMLIDHVTSCTAKKKKRKNRSGTEFMECDVCHKKMQKRSLRMHKNIKHAGLGPVCEHCGLRLANKFRLGEHYRAKHGYDKFKCSYCKFESASTMALKNHERKHRGEKPFVCDACGAKFHAAYLLMQHKQSHRTERLVKCDLCPATFKANNSLHMHKSSCHSRLAYKCAECGHTFNCKNYALRHANHAHTPRASLLEAPREEGEYAIKRNK